MHSLDPALRLRRPQDDEGGVAVILRLPAGQGAESRHALQPGSCAPPAAAAGWRGWCPSARRMTRVVSFGPRG